MKKFSQNFGKIALCGVVGIERKSSGFGKLPNKQKSPAVGRQKTDDFTEGYLFPMLAPKLITLINIERTGKEWKGNGKSRTGISW